MIVADWAIGPEDLDAALWQRLLGRPVSEYGRLCHGDGGHEWSGRRRRALMLATLRLEVRDG